MFTLLRDSLLTVLIRELLNCRDIFHDRRHEAFQTLFLDSFLAPLKTCDLHTCHTFLHYQRPEDRSGVNLTTLAFIQLLDLRDLFADTLRDALLPRQ